MNSEFFKDCMRTLYVCYRIISLEKKDNLNSIYSQYVKENSCQNNDSASAA